MGGLNKSCSDGVRPKFRYGIRASVWMFCLVCCLGAASCRRTVEKARQNIRVECIERADLRGASGCDIVLQVRNDTRYKLVLASASFDLFYGSACVGTIVLRRVQRCYLLEVAHRRSAGALCAFPAHREG